MKSLESICKKYKMSKKDFNKLLDVVGSIKDSYAKNEVIHTLTNCLKS
jgi:hypothetical protein